jgi:phosphoribosyl-ATP pyrophosphohydrolase/phosphoribosyl-AMP cyclohydrolase/histidinol dehydrogenase
LNTPRESLLPRRTPGELARSRHDPVDGAALADAAAIMADVRAGGLDAVMSHAVRLGDITAGAPLIYTPDELAAARDALPTEQRDLIERAASRIERFAQAQRTCLKDLDIAIQGGRAGHRFLPVGTAGCYAPGGRFPLPSSVLMTAITARLAGVQTVWVASPRPGPATLAAAAIAGATGLLAAGGAQAIAAFAHGAGPVPRCDTIVGPGNRWVTAAKHLVSRVTSIDMLAGPSEVLIIADDTADPAVIAADLLAQAEHDTDAVPILLTTSARLVDAVEAELTSQLETLPTAQIARVALRNGASVVVGSLEEAARLSDSIAPEHLEVITANAPQLAKSLHAYGAIFIGARSAEVMGDYGAGPNHVLPTGGSARGSAGLSVFSFLHARTWIEIDESPESANLCRDTAALGRVEGLEAHARAAEKRLR